ncbi:DUF5804 family protein [Halocatena halophila]|uniref:DUF5804 family protein n=1 Tax=Halocatena halophila TaxID=2814576 RepID=UPI002ED58ABB
MTTVCLLGKPEYDLRTELLSRQTARRALSTYQLRQPYENTIAIQTISLGAAVAFCNDLNWYLVRFTDDVLIREPSITDTEWLSKPLAIAIRENETDPDTIGPHLKVFGVEPLQEGPPKLVEPMYATMIDGSVPEYDLRPVERTETVYVTQSEWGD